MKICSPLSPEDEQVVSATIGCGIAVHRELGPGFKESIYHRTYRLELESRGLDFETDKPILVKYRDWLIPGQRLDLLVEKVVLVEIKTVPALRPLHRHQLLSYLKTTGLRVGLLMNFNASLLKKWPGADRSVDSRGPTAGADPRQPWSSSWCSSSCSWCSSCSS